MLYLVLEITGATGGKLLYGNLRFASRKPATKAKFFAIELISAALFPKTVLFIEMLPFHASSIIYESKPALFLGSAKFVLRGSISINKTVFIIYWAIASTVGKKQLRCAKLDQKHFVAGCKPISIQLGKFRHPQ